MGLTVELRINSSNVFAWFSLDGRLQFDEVQGLVVFLSRIVETFSIVAGQI